MNSNTFFILSKMVYRSYSFVLLSRGVGIVGVRVEQ